MRYLCAYNFPALVGGIGGKRFAMYIHSTFKILCEDKDTMTRKTIALCFHEVAKILGTELSPSYLKDPFIKLLKVNRRES